MKRRPGKNIEGTRTSSFGVSKRENHDSSAFYSSKMYLGANESEPLDYSESAIASNILNSIIERTSENMAELPDRSVHLMVTSPPYNVGKDYDNNLSLDEFIGFLNRVWSEVYRVLVPGGRACVNIANVGRKPYIPLHSYIISGMQKIGFLMRGEIIWHKGASSGGSCAWGSWQSPANPTLRDVHEYILVFSKGSFKRANPQKRNATITRDEFLEYTKSVWSFPTAGAKKIGHPAPFPVELPYRLIQLYTFAGEVVLDPFMGSAQTGIAALKAGRRFIGYETDRKYTKLARKRLSKIAAVSPSSTNSRSTRPTKLPK